MKKLSIHAFILFVLFFIPIFANAEVRNVTVHGTVHEGYYEKLILDAVNEQRRNAGVPEIQMDMALTQAARQRAIEIGTYYDSRHLRTNLGSAASVMDDYGIFYRAFGENIAAGYSNVGTVMDAWINSTPHYNNIVNTKYSAIGIGVYQSNDGKWFWVQNFKDSVTNVYTPDTTRSNTRNYAVRYEDTIRSSYGSDSLSDQTLNVDESYEIPFHVTTYNEVTNSSIPLYLLDWTSSNPAVCEIQTINQVVSVHAKSAGTAKIYTTFGGVEYSFGVTVNGGEVVEPPKKVKVTTDFNTEDTLLDIDSNADLSTLRLSIDTVSHNSITLYYDDQTMVNPSALNFFFCEGEDCSVKPTSYQSGDEKIAKYSNGSFIFQNSGRTTITAIFENGVQVAVPIEVSSYQFEQKEYNLFTGTTKQANVISDKELENTLQSLNPEVADIDSNGIITAKKQGTATLKATRSDQTTTYAKVNVYDKGEFVINVDREEVEVTEDETCPIQISTNMSNASISTKIIDESIVNWKDDGVLQGIKKGNTTLEITATSVVAKDLVLETKKEVPIKVLKKEIKVTDISIEKSSYELLIGESLTIPASVIPENADHKELTWKSSDSKIVSVDSNGKVLAIKAGEAVITVMASNEVSKDITVSVSEASHQTIQVDKTHVELNVGDVDTIQVIEHQGSLVWTSDDVKIATVSQDGIVTAVSKGTTIIRVTNEEEEVAIPAVINQPITSIEVSSDSIELTEGEETTIKATIKPEDTTDSLDLKWTISKDIVTVDSEGKVKALSEGEADITIESVNGVQKKVHLKVNKRLIPISNLILSVTSLELVENDTYKMNVSVEPSNTTDSKQISFSSGNDDIVLVDQSGNVTAVAVGSTTISIRSSNGIVREIPVVVKKKVVKNEFNISFEQNPLTIENKNGKAVLRMIEKKDKVSLSDNEELITRFAIEFVEGTNQTFTNPIYHIAIPINKDLTKYARVYVGEILNGVVDSMIQVTIEDGAIHYTTDHLSEYAVIGVSKAKGEITPSPSPSSTSDSIPSNNPNTSSSILIYGFLWIIAFLILCGMTKLLIQRIKKENDLY